MEANELRINNWIIEPGQDENKPFQIFSIYHETGNNKVNGLPITYFKPIPLTEEWLIRFGFEKTSNNEHTKDRFVIRKQQRDLVINGFEYDYNGILLSRPEYVHTLQNLYFALMGEELTIKN